MVRVLLLVRLLILLVLLLLLFYNVDDFVRDTETHNITKFRTTEELPQSLSIRQRVLSLFAHRIERRV